MHLQVSQQQLTIRQQLSTVYEGRLVGLDVEPSVGMQVVSSVDCMLPILTLSYVSIVSALRSDDFSHCLAAHYSAACSSGSHH